MLLYHVTSLRRWQVICWQGLWPITSQGARPVVWLCSRSKLMRSARCVLRAHGWRPDDLVVIRVQVRRGWLDRYRRGVWCTRSRVPAQRLQYVGLWGGMCDASRL